MNAEVTASLIGMIRPPGDCHEGVSAGKLLLPQGDSFAFFAHLLDFRDPIHGGNHRSLLRTNDVGGGLLERVNQ
jgi:hypothetical protein